MNAMAGEMQVQKTLEQTAHVEIADHHNPSETALIYAVRFIPGGAATILLIIAWALRQRLRKWITGVIAEAMARGKKKGD